jgi:uncharacterized protein (TIGR02145 family)
MHKKLPYLFLIGVAFTIYSCSKSDFAWDLPKKDSHFNPQLQYGSVKDQEGNSYATIQIGGQLWMAENLRTTIFLNGDSIDQSSGTSLSSTQAYWCYYDNNSQYENPYGKLYNYYAVADPRKVCPEGWHVPNDSDWSTLIMYLGGDAVAGGKMKSTMYWTYNYSASNESGFSGLPGGDRNANGSFYDIGLVGYWWSSPENGNNYVRYLNSFSGGVYRVTNGKSDGISVRCLRD